MRPALQLIPAIDLRGGHCVRLLKGDFSAETRYPDEPTALLERYRDCGADWLHLVDLDAARDGSGGNREMILALARTRTIKLQMGGGLRDHGGVAAMLRAGVERVVIGSAAVGQVERVREWLGEFGCERITLAFDVRLDHDGAPHVTTHGWQRQSALTLWQAVDAYAGHGLIHVLCTDVDRDGALTGPNTDLYADARRRHPQIQWQASGGIRSAADLRALEEAGATAAISGKALLENLIPLAELRPFLPNA